MDKLVEFIPEELLILVVATYVFGIFLKKIEFVKDKYITVILMTLSIIFSMIITGATPTAFLQGILTWGVSVGINQSFKQLNKVE